MPRSCTEIRLPLLLGLLLLTALTATGRETEPDASPVSRLELRTIEADVSPSVDVTLPSGNIALESSRFFANLGFTLGIGYNFLDNRISAQVGFFYPLGLFVPELVFFDSVDFESTVKPQVSFDEVSLIPSERYVSRQRGGEARLWFRPNLQWRIGPSFKVAEVFQGSLSAGEVIEDALFYTARLSASLDTITSTDLLEDVFAGVEASSSLDWRFRNRLDRPTELDHISLLAIYSGLWRDLAVETRIQTAYPLKVWDNDREVFYSLGGVDTVRGFKPATIHAYRYALGSLDIRPALFRRFRIPLRVRKTRGQIHRFRLLFLADVAATQASTDLQSDIAWHAGAGAGLSLVLSGERGNHIRTRFFAAWPLEPHPAPIFYWQTSLFSLADRI